MSEHPLPRRGRNLIAGLLKYVIPLIVSIGLCWLLFTGIDFARMLDIIRRDCDFRWIAFALALSMLSYLFRALRWRMQLAALGICPPLGSLVLSMFGTYAVNLVFPRLGEIWRSGYIARRQDAPFTSVFGSMVAERLSDTVTVLLITLLAFALASGAIITYLEANAVVYDKLVELLSSPLLWIGMAALAALTWWLFNKRSSNGIVGRIRCLMRELWDGFAVIATMPGKWLWLVWTVCLWGCYFAQMLVAFNAFPSTRAVISGYGLPAVLVTFAISSISMGVPSNGGIGPWQWAVIFALGIYGVESADAGAFANVVLGSQTVVQIMLGVFTFAMIAFEKRRDRRSNTGLSSSSTNKNIRIKQCQKS